MTQEDKELLLKDLCGRLPYGVKVELHDEVCTLLGYFSDFVMLTSNTPIGQQTNIANIKPYLRPMYSMTEEEESEYLDIKKGECDGCVLTGKGDPNTEFMLIDFYNKHHFDYRGLIEKGLAIAVTEENNPYKES